MKKKNFIEFIVLPLVISILWGFLIIFLKAKGPALPNLLFNILISHLPFLIIILSPFLLLFFIAVSARDLWRKYVKKGKAGASRSFYLTCVYVFFYFIVSFWQVSLTRQHLDTVDQKALESAKHVAKYYIENGTLPEKVFAWKGESEKVSVLGIKSTLTYEPEVNSNNFVIKVSLGIHPKPRLWARDVTVKCSSRTCVVQRYRHGLDEMVTEEIEIAKEQLK